MTENKTGRTVKWARTILFLVVAVAAALFLLRVFVPKPRPAPMLPDDSYSVDVMQAAVAPEKVKSEQDKILSFGSRFLGSPGFYKTEEYIRQRFQDAGLEIVEQVNRTAIPRTLLREIYVEENNGGQPSYRQLNDVEVFPFWPNHMQPMVTPEDGITGEVILLTDEALKTRESFRGCIGLINSAAGQAPLDLKYDWQPYAALGLSALIVTHPLGFDHMPWETIVGDGWIPAWGFMNESVPINFVRLAATPGILDYVGRRVKLRVKTIWDNEKNTTIIGMLRATRPANKVMLVMADYGACSMLPDHAPGVLQTLEPAIQLCLLDGLAQMRDSLTRDVFFVAQAGRVMSEDGAKNLMRVLGISQTGAQENRLLAALSLGGQHEDCSANAEARLKTRLDPLDERYQANARKLEMVELILARFEDARFLVERTVTSAALDEFDGTTADFLKEQCKYVLDTIVLEKSEEKLDAKIEFERDVTHDLEGEPFGVYLAATRRYEQARTSGGYLLENLLDNRAEFLQTENVRNRWRERFEELRAFHIERKDFLERDMAVVRAFNPYDEVFTIIPNILPAFDEHDRTETVSFGAGLYLMGPPERAFESLLVTARQHAKLEDKVELPKVMRWHDNTVWKEMGKTPYGMSEAWRCMGYPCYRVMNFGRVRSYDRFSEPCDLPFMHDVESMRYSLALVGETTACLAHGLGKFPPSIGEKYDFLGRVLVSNVGQSIVPDYPLKNALIGTKSRVTPVQFHAPGYYTIGLKFADVYGEFDYFNVDIGFNGWVNQQLSLWDGFGFSPVACGFGDDGLIAYIKDEGEDGQRMFKSMGITYNDRVTFKDLTIVTFRATPITFLDLDNPQDDTPYGYAELVDKDTLAPFRKRCTFTLKSPFMSFIEPDERFYVKLQAGSDRNKLALETRAFMLGSDDNYTYDPTREIDGPGYLAADTPFVLQAPFEISRSMLGLNGKRLALQNDYAIADQRVNLYHQRADALDSAAREPGQPEQEARLKARDSVTYNQLNHPVLRDTITAAIIGIIWYLALLVPFCFFFEKLVFGFPDIRKQLAVFGMTFLVVFLLLWLLHPAFQMVQSSLMILLGFVIILISGGVMVLFFGKFQENLEEFQKKRGTVSGAAINVMGAIATAFLLGLNNMHRRRIRTGLTCVTLVLMTFVVICFTSIQSDVVEETVAIGKAPFQGILLKKKNFEPIDTVVPVTEKYNDVYDVCPREMYVGQPYLGQSYNPSLEISYEPQPGAQKRVDFLSIVKLASAEPLREKIKFLTKPNWFTPQQEREEEALCPVMLPDSIAAKLGITPERVEQGDCVLMVNGVQFRVQGIFTAESFSRIRDMDGFDLLPFDIKAIPSVVTLRGYEALAQDSDPRIPAEQVVLCPAKRDLKIQPRYGLLRCVSVAIAMPAASYKEAKAAIESYLERKAERVFFGLGGVAYRGRRTREMTFAGMLDLLLPLLIAALTVMNTMRGSVYERRDEIFVYNAVGIAPRYVFFMFFAEAIVYAIVGSVLGYVFSQGLGRILVALDLTAGMNISFTSLSSIYASLAIAGTVFLSTYFPARSAMLIAAPAEESGWRLPEPENDDLLRFRLPFLFTSRDRIAILAFFDRYLQDHGEGGAGRFFAGPPEVSLLDPQVTHGGGHVPAIACTVWLKPFDLAVSQQITLSVPKDAETGEFVAEITLRRISGTRESWLRLNVAFVRLVRQHLLHWRAVTDDDRLDMFEEGKQLIETQLASKVHDNGLEYGRTKTGT